MVRKHLLWELIFTRQLNFITIRNVENDSPEYQYFLNFDKAHVQGKMEPYRTEWEVYDEDIKLAGSIDKVYKLIMDDGSEKYMIYDWKRSKGIKETNNFESAYPPIEHLLIVINGNIHYN